MVFSLVFSPTLFTDPGSKKFSPPFLMLWTPLKRESFRPVRVFFPRHRFCEHQAAEICEPLHLKDWIGKEHRRCREISPWGTGLSSSISTPGTRSGTSI